MADVVGVKFHFMVDCLWYVSVLKIRDLEMLAIDPVVAPGIISSNYLGSFHTLRSISKTGRVPGFSIDFFFKKIMVFREKAIDRP